MDSTVSLVWCLVSALCLLLPSLEACMCAEDKHLQQHFCEADYVIKARILKQKAIYDTSGEIKMKIPRAIQYKIKLLKSFKIGTPSSQVPVEETAVYTSVTSCGVGLNKGKTYLIVGPMKNGGEQWVESCNYVREWKEVTPHQRKFMKFGRYAKHCACLPKMTGRRSRKFCSTTSPYWDCFSQFSYCEVNRRNRCQWQPNQPLFQCLRMREP